MRYLLITLLLIGTGCTTPTESPLQDQFSGGDRILNVEELTDPANEIEPQPTQHLPITGDITFKGFGEYIEDRFTGYHVGLDFEAPANTPVYALMDGEVRFADWISGYGGVMTVLNIVNGTETTVLYGHLDPDSMSKVGETVLKGDQIGVLGEEGEETDGERTHLHLGVYGGEKIQLRGYTGVTSSIDFWRNPYDLIEPSPNENEEVKSSSELIYNNEAFPITFNLPIDWDIEYIPSIQALNLYTLSGKGSARERSQILIRYFDASDFLTLSTVTIHETTDLIVGDNYTARRYDIEKQDGVPDFPDQPSWRNQRHIVTDFRREDGTTRYFVIAANPELDPTIYESLLQSIK